MSESNGGLADELRRAAALIREIPDFPQPGVLFRDLSPLLADPAAFRTVITALAAPAVDADVVVGIEARGFLLGGGVASAAGLGLVAARKPGKLPVVAHRVDYVLEYGTASLELPADTLRPGQRVLLVDDVLATGGTAAAAVDLVRQVGATVAGIAVVLELAALAGRERLVGQNLHVLLTV